MHKARSLLPAGLLCLVTAVSVFAAGQSYDVRDYGAKADGKTLCTEAIQKAIDQCAADGGGTVYLPPGTWLSGTIFIKSHVTLKLDSGCTLLGSPHPEDYPQRLPSVRSYTDNYVRQSLIAGENVEHVAIRGRGTIDGHGSRFRWKQYKNRPYVIRLVGCRDVLVENVRLQNSPMWMQHYLACDRVRLRGVTVYNHVSYNNDGLNIDGCRDVSVSGCMIDSDDDALCLKSTLDRPCENVTITNCVLSSHCNAIKMGTESHGGFRNISVANCTICSPRYSKAIYGRQRGLAGIALEIVDGGHLNGVTISNIAIEGVSTPIFMRLGNRGRTFKKELPKPGVGTFRNVILSNIIATHAARIGCSITGLPGHRIENVSLRDIKLSFEGGGSKEEASREVPEKEASYPESTMFGVLPAYGFYCRHVKGLKLSNVQLQTAKPDLRHAIVCEDLEDLVVDGLDARFSPDAAAMIRLTQTRGAFIRGCRPQTAVGTFLKLEGDTTRRVVLMGNDLSLVNKIADIAADIPGKALTQVANQVTEKR